MLGEQRAGAATFKNILVAIDGSPTAEKGLQHAIARAAQGHGRLTVLHVLDLYAARAHMQMAPAALYLEHLQGVRRCARQLLDQAAGAAAVAGVQATTVLRELTVAHIADAIVEEAGNGFDLIVLGTHGRRGVRRFFPGSDAELVVRTAPVPVVLVRCDDGQ